MKAKPSTDKYSKVQEKKGRNDKNEENEKVEEINEKVEENENNEKQQEEDITNDKRKLAANDKQSIFARVKKVKQEDKKSTKISSAINIPKKNQPEEKVEEKQAQPIGKRDKAMFGFLINHLKSAKKILSKEELHFKKQTEKDNLVAKKQEQEREQQQQRDEEIRVKGKQEVELIELELELNNKQLIYSLQEKNLLLLSNFLQTKNEPKIYWKLGNNKSLPSLDQKLEESKKLHIEQCEVIKKRLDTWVKDFKENNPQLESYVKNVKEDKGKEKQDEPKEISEEEEQNEEENQKSPNQKNETQDVIHETNNDQQENEPEGQNNQISQEQNTTELKQDNQDNQDNLENLENKEDENK